jgi:hypothetical protein
VKKPSAVLLSEKPIILERCGVAKNQVFLAVDFQGVSKNPDCCFYRQLALPTLAKILYVVAQFNFNH